jgi:hypothetical protein
MPMDQLPRLQRWLLENCGDDPPEGLISIESTDDPGWSVLVDLSHTPLAERPFDPVEEDEDPAAGLRWISCSVYDGMWSGVCDAGQLPRVLDIFLDWANGARPSRR